MKRRGRKAAAFLVIGLIAVSATVAGYAYWTTSGSGSGSASVGTDTPWQVVVDPAVGGPLTPGGPTQTVGYTVTNNSTGNQYLAGVTVSVAESDGSVWNPPGNCSAADFSLNGEPAGTPAVLTALSQTFGGGGSGSSSVSVQMVDRGVDQNDCRLLTVPLRFVAG